MTHRSLAPPAVAIALLLLAAHPTLAERVWSVDDNGMTLALALRGVVVARYAYADPTSTRPSFFDVASPSGVRVTRAYPPQPGEDLEDHPLFHPGVWFALGDLSGADNWRLKATVENAGFRQLPVEEEGVLRFVVKHRWLDAEGQALATSETTHTLRELAGGTLLTYDLAMKAVQPLGFGDQEEMGFGVRLRAALREGGPSPTGVPAATGEVLGDDGRRSSATLWGQPARWLDYRGELNGEPAGLSLFCHPENALPSRMHVRNYGLVCANPFATAAFKAGPTTRHKLPAGEVLRLRYGVLAHSGAVLGDAELEPAWRAYADVTP